VCICVLRFPWEMATAVSEKVFEDGLHEFLVSSFSSP